MVLLFAVAFYRIFHIQSVEGKEWLALEQELNRKRPDRPVYPNRGNIYSHDMKLLASTTPYYYLVMDMRAPALHRKEKKNEKKTFFDKNVDSLAYCLSRKFGDRTAAAYKHALVQAYKRKDSRFRVYPNILTYSDLEDVKKMPLFRAGRNGSGLIPDEFTTRICPFDPLAKRTIGAVYADRTRGGGIYGIERFFDSLLRGQAGLEQAKLVGTSWNYFSIKEPVDGADIITTLDMDIQDITSQALLEQMRRIGAERGCALVMDVKTGEIRACANLSLTASGNYKEYENMAVSDLTEPGSTFKTVSMMVALENDIVTPTDTIDASFSPYDSMTDTHFNGRITATEVLARSSNIGMSNLIDGYYRKKPEEFVDGIYKIKLQEPMQIEIPGAGKPNIRRPEKDLSNWSPTALPWMSIGYETQLPPIYTLRFYNAIANDGKMVNPHFVKAIVGNGQNIQTFDTEVVNSSICSSKTLTAIRAMLEAVVNDKHGTGYAQVRSTRVAIAGKTGTAQVNYGGSKQKTHQASFCGYFPADNPQYSCIVVMLSRGVYGATSGMVFKQIAERVYAQNNFLSIKDVKIDSMLPMLPVTKNSSWNTLAKALQYLDIDFNGQQTDWVITKTDSAFVRTAELPLIDNLVPNVVGMGAKDAVYLMEQRNLYVQIFGRGTVVSQSLPVGSRAQKGATVSLILQ
ncbi:MAG: transpeptidase family protein [Prevotellaceae bacterium]|jgi:cell division protein FtsI (penicillin-binding protein 3)|nr:transpeptidase family protein [Prevotellaceae bacterium]